MSANANQIKQLEAAIAAQESLRPMLGDDVVDATLAALRAKVDALGGKPQASAGAAVSAEQLMAQFMPKELADKIRALGRIEGERKQVTVLFSDLSGYTALGERLDPEDVMALSRELLKELADAVYEHEGYIENFMGDAVMAIFGAPVTHEDDPERALRAALNMRERIERLNERWLERLGEPLTLHIGVNTGTVIAGTVGSDMRMSYSVAGDVVNTASRLQSAAEPGQILVSRETQRLTRGAFTFKAHEPITAKNKREPVAAFELQHAKASPLKERGLKELGESFVGRERQLEQLRAIGSDLSEGRGRIAMLTGDAGIGKSRLMAEWRRANGEGSRWLEGRCFAHTTALAYGPFLDLFRRYANMQDDDTEAEARAGLHTGVERFFGSTAEAQALLASLFGMRLLPEEEAIIGAIPTQMVRQKIFGLLSRGFEDLSRNSPTILVLEDMHWADSTSLELIEALLPLTERVPLAIICVFRWSEDERLGKLVKSVRSRYADRTVHIALSPLSNLLSLQMIEQLLTSRELPSNLKELILNKAEGNPFYVEEVIRMLIERGALVRADAGQRWVDTALMDTVSVPDTLQGVLMSRLDRLPAETKWLAQQASVIGRVFLYRVLLQVTAMDLNVDADLSYLERQELIRERARDPEVEYIFKHALTQEVAYQSLLAPRRKELHRRVGEAMEIIFGERLSEFSSIIGTHFWRGETWDKAAHYLIQAGDTAAKLYSNAEARQHYAHALEALKHLPDSDDSQRRRINTATQLAAVSIFVTDPNANLTLLGEFEGMAKKLAEADGATADDTRRLARVNYWIGRAYYTRASFPEAMDYFRRVLSTAQGDPQLAAIPSSLLGQALALQGRFGQARPLLEQSIEPLERAADWSNWLRSTGHLGIVKAAQGQYAEGVKDGESALARAIQINNPADIAAARAWLVLIYLLGGDADLLAEASRQAIETAEKSGALVFARGAHGFAALASSRQGQHDRARQSMERARVLGEQIGGRLVLQDWLAVANAELALNASQHDEALKRSDDALREAKSVGSILTEGMGHRVRGHALSRLDVPRWDEADQSMEQSLHLFEQGQAHVERARTYRAWGHVHHKRGNHTAARKHLEQAASQFEEYGLSAELADTRELIDALPH